MSPGPQAGNQGSRIAIYARVSKGEFQNPENQLIPLREWANATGARTYETHVDQLSSRDRRPAKEEVLRKLRVGLLGTVAVVRLDRWGRSLGELATELDEFVRRRWTFVSLKEGFRIDTAIGRMEAHMLGVFAEFERDLISDRTVAGLDRARSQGKLGGRHPVGCGCGARPEGRPPHDGPVKPVRDGNRLIAWRWPDGRELPVRSNGGRPRGDLATPSHEEDHQTSVCSNDDGSGDTSPE